WVAVAMTAPKQRQAGAQGLLGAAETLTAGITSVMAGVLYSVGGRTLAYGACTVGMLALVTASYVLAGPEFRARCGVDGDDRGVGDTDDGGAPDHAVVAAI